MSKLANIEALEDALKRLPEPYRQKALDNFKQVSIHAAARIEKMHQEEFTSLHDCINFAFDWFTSIEGFDYWANAYFELRSKHLATNN